MWKSVFGSELMHLSLHKWENWEITNACNRLSDQKIANLMKDVNESIAENESTTKGTIESNQFESSQRDTVVVKNLMMKNEDDCSHHRPSSITGNKKFIEKQPVRMHSHRGRGIDTETKWREKLKKNMIESIGIDQSIQFAISLLICLLTTFFCVLR